MLPGQKDPMVSSINWEMLHSNSWILPMDLQDVDEFHNLMNNAYFFMTDSDSIQEEAPSLGKSVLVMRDTTERLENLDA